MWEGGGGLGKKVVRERPGAIGSRALALPTPAPSSPPAVAGTMHRARRASVSGCFLFCGQGAHVEGLGACICRPRHRPSALSVGLFSFLWSGGTFAGCATGPLHLSRAARNLIPKP